MFALKNILLFIIIFCGIFAGGFFLMLRYWPMFFGSDALWQDYTIEKRQIDGKELRLIVADDPEKWSKGLMHIKEKSAEFDGMIFRFPSAYPRMFWNMNTFVDLKLYWIRDGKVIGTSDLPSITKSKTVVTRSSPGSADSVIEVVQ
jgi:uncharacterized membrane protein (UPF0127 family)